MPTTYAHDLFGKRVYKKLPKEIREVIRAHGNLYRIGLHGPDILFYYMVSKNPVTQFGVYMHEEKARCFFEQGMQRVRETKDEALLAYLLGFGCHYLLDSKCHPFVNEMADANVISHTLLEKEFDRELMLKTGKNPYKYYPSDAVKSLYYYAHVIHKALPLVKTGNIWISLKMMKLLTNLMVCNDHGRKRLIIEKILSRSGKQDTRELMEHFMTKEIAPGSVVPVGKLKKLFHESTEEAPQYIQELYSLSKIDQNLSDRWDRTYNG